ncbi:hypothetical protein GCM10010320_03730 [Streptomyces caelestis]|uniref:Tyr recombinase domain-containing protein n=1 Tax=Streptomyces caelestis TaxID=36816 RepID=A0A7W9H3T7_9ACTN|nr:hypothetical protein [Streptomyces caelestis]GGW28156.1 hypothetical protein GCM10010320_03730 [Streptomyces caelestis]
MHALRHLYASVLLDAGESIKALSLYLGHSDPGFILRVYTHLMPSSEPRTRKAISAMYRAAGHAHDGPETPDGPSRLRRPLIGRKTAGERPFHACSR